MPVVAMPTRPGRAPELVAAGFAVVADWSEAHAAGVTRAVIATNTSRHGADVADAVAAGCAVLVEKPVAEDAVHARAIAAVAAGSPHGVWVGCCLRFRRGMQTVRELLPSLGPVHSVRIECQSYLPDWRPSRPYRDSYSARAEEGGVLRDLIHEIDYAGWLFGWPEALQATVANTGRLGIEADDAADLLWRSGDGMTVSLRLDYLSRTTRRRLVVCGSRGSLEWDLPGGTVTIGHDGAAPVVHSVEEGRDDMYLAQDAAFLEATRAAFHPSLATADDGARALAICDAARRASATRCEEQVRYA
jgi:predicted dehydrogenase